VRCGVELYELNETIRKRQGKRFTWLPGLSKSSLHAKVMAIDGEIMFVGSLNFDPRSLNINNEIGVLFHEPQLAASASKRFDEHIGDVAFKVSLVSRGNGKQRLQWSATEEGNEIVFDSEPYAGFWKILGVNLMRALPIDAML